MSVASSCASETSCVYDGRIMDVETMLDNVTRSAQQRLTDLQMSLRLLCAAEDQSIDDITDFKMCVENSDQVQDFVEGLAELLSELPRIALDIVGTCPPECKAWYAAHREARKTILKNRALAQKEAGKTRKDLVKSMKMASIEEKN